MVIIFYILLLYFIFSPEIVSSFPVILIIDSFTIFIYLSIFLVFYFYDIKPIEVFLIALATTYLLMDLDYKLLNEYIRPGGSDSLTYESFSRLILEGSFFQGGEKVYTYSPAARYFIFFSHLLFGEKLKYVFILLNGLAAYLVSVNKSFKFDKKNVFAYLAFFYLTSNAINRIFIFGMSEIFSLILILLFLKLNVLKNSYPIITGLVLGLALINRPILALGILVIVIRTKNLKTLFSFITISLLPFFHNIIYGNKLTLFTEDWNYQGDVLGGNLSFQEQTSQIMSTALKNANYVFMNPFYLDVYMRVGRLLPLIFSISIIYSIFIFIQRRKQLNIFKEFTNLIPIALFVAPFVIYNPIYFYPRFLLVPHIVFLIYCQNLKNELS